MLDQIPSISDYSSKAEAIDTCKDRIKSASGTKRSFKMEIRLVQDVNARRKYETRLNELDSMLKRHQADLKAIEQEMQRGELMGGGDGDPELGGEDAVKAGDNMLAEASNLQDKTGDSLSNTKALIAESKEVGVSTLDELERQREVLHSIEREVDRVDDNLARAEKLLKQFGKRMAGDHFIQCFTAVNVCMLLGVIAYAIVNKGAFGGEPPVPVEPV
jgi:hypothetical protein